MSVNRDKRVFNGENKPFLDKEEFFWSHLPGKQIESLVIKGGNFIQDLCLPKMLHGRIFRPLTTLHRLDRAEISHIS